ncbi:MAG: hypothetical protein KDN22_34175, partial [Verrucomicrobiae bacterium]|nr:hypothetical protein [Verrucomicrobiae bacterium]
SLIQRHCLIDCPFPPNHYNLPIPAIAELNRQLRELEIDLIVVPIPPRELYTWRFFPADPPAGSARINPNWERAISSLLEHDIETVDLLLEIERAHPLPQYLYFDQVDPHPADGIIRLAARVLGSRLARYPLNAWRNVEGLRLRRVPIYPPGWYLQQQGGSFDPYYCGIATQVVDESGFAIPESVADSPILVFGDSFVGSLFARACDVVSHVTYETGVMPTRLEIGGSAPSIQIHIARERERYLNGKRVCVFVFNGRELLYPFPPSSEMRPKKRWMSADLAHRDALDSGNNGDERDIVLEILSAPDLPAASELDYPSCLGIYECRRQSRAEEILLSGWVFLERERTSMAGLRKGDFIRCGLVAMQEAPDSAINAARIDSSDRFDLPLFFCEDFTKLNAAPAEHFE